MIGVQETVETGILGLRNYVRHSEERLLLAACTLEEDEDRESSNEYKKRKKMNGKHIGHKINYMDSLSGKQRVKQVKIGVDGKENCLKRTTEALIMAAQEQAIITNNIEAKIDKTQESRKCRMCGKVEENVNDVLSECSKLAQKEYKR